MSDYVNVGRIHVPSLDRIFQILSPSVCTKCLGGDLQRELWSMPGHLKMSRFRLDVIGDAGS